jgi:acyl homoserine lactone synthase
MAEITIARRGDSRLDDSTLRAMFRLRHAIFHDRLGWDVTSDDGMEHDEFDEINPVYMIVKDDDQHVVGCWRLLPTTGPYMLKDVFPQLLAGQPAPMQPDVWELSRFAMLCDKSECAGFDWSETPRRMMQFVVRYAQENGIHRYVTVTSAAVERLLRKLGVNISRLGPPIRIGKVLTLACAVEIDQITELAVYGVPEHASRKAA